MEIQLEYVEKPNLSKELNQDQLEKTFWLEVSKYFCDLHLQLTLTSFSGELAGGRQVQYKGYLHGVIYFQQGSKYPCKVKATPLKQQHENTLGDRCYVVVGV